MDIDHFDIDSLGYLPQVGHDLGQDLLNSDYIRGRVDDKVYAQNLYAAMCNNEWIFMDPWVILSGSPVWSISWRGAGRLVSQLRRQGDYMDWYCSGLVRGYDEDRVPGYVGEGYITDEIHRDLRDLGWNPRQAPDDSD